jgi:hypothetical protein
LLGLLHAFLQIGPGFGDLLVTNRLEATASLFDEPADVLLPQGARTAHERDDNCPRPPDKKTRAGRMIAADNDPACNLTVHDKFLSLAASAVFTAQSRVASGQDSR